MSVESDNRLAKLYMLMDDGEWREECMGIVILSAVDEEADHIIEIYKVGEDTEVLKRITINPEILYQDNDRCLIQWSEDSSHEYALSFLMADYRDAVMKQIRAVCSSYGKDFHTSQQVMLDGPSSFVLPDVSMASFPEIASALQGITFSDVAYVINRFSDNDDAYLKELLEIADTYIALDDLEAVHSLARAIIYLVSLGISELDKVLFSDSLYLLVFNVLNYSNDNYATLHADHCSALQERTHFHDVLQINQTNLQQLVHVTFRLIFFRDVVSPEIAGMSTNSGITSVINENTQKILSILCENKQYANQIMKLLDPNEDITEVVGLLFEMFSMSILANDHIVMSLFKAFCGYEELDDEFGEKSGIAEEPMILDKFYDVLKEGKQKIEVVQKIVLIIEQICRLNPSFCCSYFMNKEREKAGNLLRLLLTLLLHNEDAGVQQSVYQTLGILFGRDPTMNLDDHLYLRLFYSSFFPILEHSILHEPALLPNAFLLVVELITAFLPIHQSFLRGILTAGKLMDFLVRKLPLKTNSEFPMVNRCAIIRFLAAGMNLRSAWFPAILVRRHLMKYLYELTIPEILQKDCLLTASLRNLFQLAVTNNHVEVILDASENIPNLGIEEIVPFSKIMEVAKEKVLSEPEKSEMQEKLEEEAYFDAMESDEESSMLVPLEKNETPDETPDEMSVEDDSNSNLNSNSNSNLNTNTNTNTNANANANPSLSNETPNETPNEKPEEQPSIVSFFGKAAGLTPANNLKLNLTIDLGSMDSKRPKIDATYSVCFTQYFIMMMI